jgi:hypothetical protein
MNSSPLEYAYISEVFPDGLGETVSRVAQPPEYSPVGEELDVKPYDKLRLVKGVLTVDNRWFRPITRMYTGDNRSNILDELEKTKYSHNTRAIIRTLMKTTYKNDRKFVNRCKIMLDEAKS